MDDKMQPRDPLIWALEWAGMLPPLPAGESREEAMEAKIEAMRECIVELREQVDALLWLTSGRVN